ncbi:MAG: acyl-CoA reductase [Balneolaceae bacterium]
MNIQNQITKVSEAAKKWLQPDNLELKKAIEETVKEGLFSFEDIKFQIRALKQNFDSGQIEEWAKRAGLSEEKNSIGQKVLCLHAGNLPLVGLQDALGTILSGADYYGKLSKKDPYLLRSFLDELRNSEIETAINYSTDLKEFKNLKADKILFAGSSESVPNVNEELRKLNAVTEETKFVIRTAKFSMAYINNENPEVITDLVEAIFRYGGQGCRSVAFVVSPNRFNKLKCHFQDYIESFWLKNPQHKKPSKALAYQFAYNKAIGREQAWLDDFLIQESEEFPELDFTLHWVEGDETKLKELKEKFGTAVQSVYTAGEKIEGLETEFLSNAQTPDLWWEPDGVKLL